MSESMEVLLSEGILREEKEKFDEIVERGEEVAECAGEYIGDTNSFVK